MGFLDKAKKLAEQAMAKAEDALGEARERAAARTPAADGGGGTATAADPRMGTAYVPGMLGRPGWREQGLVDPAAVLPIEDRDRAGVPHSTKSRILEETFGMGRRWSAGERSVGLYYQLYPEHQAWEPPGGRSPLPEVPGASTATLPDGRALVFLGGYDQPVVLESEGLDDVTRVALARTVADQLAAGG